jgi:hypothetical protein
VVHAHEPVVESLVYSLLTDFLKDDRVLDPNHKTVYSEVDGVRDGVAVEFAVVLLLHALAECVKSLLYFDVALD